MALSFEPLAAAELLGVNPAEFDRLLSRGIIPPARVDGFRRFWSADDLRPVIARIRRHSPIPVSAESR
jgi:hypothetical protein